MVRCPQCGSESHHDANFCAQCGHRLHDPSTSDTTVGLSMTGEVELPADLGDVDSRTLSALAPGSALLVVLRGPGAGGRYLLDTEVVKAGRHPDSDVFLDDITVSRNHVEFRRTPEGYQLHDVGSLNGTYLNRQRVDDALLRAGDEVRIGKYQLTYYAPERGN